MKTYVTDTLIIICKLFVLGVGGRIYLEIIPPGWEDLLGNHTPGVGFPRKFSTPGRVGVGGWVGGVGGGGGDDFQGGGFHGTPVQPNNRKSCPVLCKTLAGPVE